MYLKLGDHWDVLALWEVGLPGASALLGYAFEEPWLPLFTPLLSGLCWNRHSFSSRMVCLPSAQSDGTIQAWVGTSEAINYNKSTFILHSFSRVFVTTKKSLTNVHALQI